jgi:hypothetical protein
MHRDLRIGALVMTVTFLITFAIALAYDVTAPVRWLPPIVAAVVGITIGVRHSR